VRLLTEMLETHPLHTTRTTESPLHDVLDFIDRDRTPTPLQTAR
jgi:hypothetical protein